MRIKKNIKTLDTGKRLFSLFFFKYKGIQNKQSTNPEKIKKNVQIMTNKPVGVIGSGSVNGVDIDFFKSTLSDEDKNIILNDLGFASSDFIITFVGRIVNDKGVNELVSVFDALSVKYSKIKLLLIGDYENETDYILQKSQNIIKNNNSIKYIEFQEDIRKYLEITSLFTLPSYREGLPNVLIEAGSYGIPLIATNINGCNEIIQHNKNGILINKKDEKDLKCAIELFLLDKLFFNKIKKTVRKSIVGKYEQKYFWNKLREEFENLERNTR